MRAIFLTEGTEVPASRYRAQLLFPLFERAGVACTHRTAYGSLYNRVHATPVGSAYKLATRMKRVLWTATAPLYDVVFMQRTALPQTALPERLLARVSDRLVFDFDDAIYLGPGGIESGWRRRAFEQAIEVSDAVIAGNQHLADVAGAPHKTTVIPTAVDTNVYVPPESRSGAPVVGWMGTAGNLPFLERVLPSVLSALKETPDARVRIVSNGRLPAYEGHPQVEQMSWSAAREVQLLQSFDVGLMPLDDTPTTRGKCGFKMIQYMAVGAGVVASGVGANPEIVGESGAATLIPGGETDWGEPVRALLRDAEARREAGLAGRARVLERYSAASVVAETLRVFRSVCAASSP